MSNAHPPALTISPQALQAPRSRLLGLSPGLVLVEDPDTPAEQLSLRLKEEPQGGELVRVDAGRQGGDGGSWFDLR